MKIADAIELYAGGPGSGRHRTEIEQKFMSVAKQQGLDDLYNWVASKQNELSSDDRDNVRHFLKGKSPEAIKVINKLIKEHMTKDKKNKISGPEDPTAKYRPR